MFKPVRVLILLTAIFITLAIVYRFNEPKEEIRNSFAQEGEDIAEIPVIESKPPVESNRIIVQYKDGSTDLQKISFREGLLEWAESSQIVPRMEILRVLEGVDKNELLKEIRNNENVEFAEIDMLVSPDVNEIIPKDPMFVDQYHIKRVMAPRAWYSQKATGIKIAVCDTGVQADHPDLKNVLIPSLGFNTADNSTNWKPIHYHGTSVSGVIAAENNNSLGVAGIAWGAKIIPVRISNDPKGWAYLSDMAECIRYASDRGAKAINLSYGGIYSSTVASAGSYAESKGAVLVMSAGNSGKAETYPNHASIIGVSATDAYDELTYFSSYGGYVDISAPGTSILTTYTGSGGYVYMAGTSFSAPIVAGTVGILAAKYPNASAATLKQYLLNSVDDIGPEGRDDRFGKGRVNVCKAVYGADSPNCPNYKNMSANLTNNLASFNFTYPENKITHQVDMSTRPDFRDVNYRDFGRGSVSPISVSSPTKYAEYGICGDIYWRMYPVGRLYESSQIYKANYSCGPFDKIQKHAIRNEAGDYFSSCGSVKEGMNRIYFGIDSACGNGYNAFFKFKNIPVLRKSKVNSANFELTVDGTFTNQMTLSITATDGVTTSSPLMWNIVDPWDGGDKKTIDLTSAIQQVIDNSSWVKDGDITIKITRVSGSGFRRVFAFEAGTGRAKLNLSVTPAPPSVPVLLLPENESLIKTMATSLEWKKSTNLPSYYNIQIDDNADFSSPSVNLDKITVTAFTPVNSNLGTVKTYYWRVRAMNAPDNWSGWSQVWSFKTAPSQPILLTPANGSTVASLKPLLSWGSVPNSSGYRIQISLNSDMSSPIIDNSSVLTNSFTPVTSLLSKKTYYWRVLAKSGLGNSSWSDKWNFKTP